MEKQAVQRIFFGHFLQKARNFWVLIKQKNIDCQLLFISDVIEVSNSDISLLENNKDKLSKFGYEIEFTSDTELIFRILSFCKIFVIIL